MLVIRFLCLHCLGIHDTIIFALSPFRFSISNFPKHNYIAAEAAMAKVHTECMRHLNVFVFRNIQRFSLCTYHSNDDKDCLYMCTAKKKKETTNSTKIIKTASATEAANAKANWQFHSMLECNFSNCRKINNRLKQIIIIIIIM